MKKLSLLSILLGVACLVPPSLNGIAGGQYQDHKCFPIGLTYCGDYQGCIFQGGTCDAIGPGGLVAYNCRNSQSILFGLCNPQEKSTCGRQATYCYDFYYYVPFSCTFGCSNMYLVCEGPNGKEGYTCTD